MPVRRFLLHVQAGESILTTIEPHFYFAGYYVLMDMKRIQKDCESKFNPPGR
jgi:hypothetical protein